MDSGHFYALIAETLGIEAQALNDESDMENTENWDSLRQVVLLMEFGRVLNIEFTPEEMMDATSVAKIKSLLATRGVVTG
jgi:acyl carrier protein